MDIKKLNKNIEKKIGTIIMSINKNIMKIIMDKMALNQWKNKVKKINGEYYRIYEYDLNCLYINSKNMCIHSNDSYYYLYQYDDRSDNKIFHNKIKKCIKCNGMYNEITYNVCKLPKNYDYTSGMDDANGYKKIE